MSADALTLAAFLALAGNPACHPNPMDVPTVKLAAKAQTESSFRPYLVAVSRGGRTVDSRAFGAAADATTFTAQRLANLAPGESLDLGLMQINHTNLVRHQLTLDTVFDPCANLRAGAEHMADDLRAAWNAASQRYNCGGFTCAPVYARTSEIAERVMAKAIRDIGGAAATLPPQAEAAVAPSPSLASPYVTAWTSAPSTTYATSRQRR